MTDVELLQLRNKIFLFYQFLADNTNMPSQWFEEPKKLVEQAFNNKDLKVLKAADKDILDNVRNMPPELAIQLEIFLKKEANIDLGIAEQLELKAIKKIIKRGDIKTTDEYQLIHDRVEYIYDKPVYSDEVSALNKLLIAYEKNNR